MALLPAFGDRQLPARVRLALAFAFTAIVAPAVGGAIGSVEPARLAGLLGTETAAGLALGGVLRLAVLALQLAGSMIAQSTSLSQLLGSAGPEPQPAIARLMVVAGLAAAVTAGLHVRLAEALILSYRVLPAGRLPGASTLAEWGIGAVAEAFGVAFTLAAPFVIAGLVYNLALGVINRAMPQLMVALVGAPAITAGGLILLALVLPALLSVWNSWLTE
ncbi:MAG: type III secretion protein, partial [Alphaproteobacteria bacterium]